MPSFGKQNSTTASICVEGSLGQRLPDQVGPRLESLNRVSSLGYPVKTSYMHYIIRSTELTYRQRGLD